MNNTNTLLFAMTGILAAVVIILVVVLLGHNDGDVDRYEAEIKKTILSQPATTYRCYQKPSNEFNLIESDGGVYETETGVSMFVVEGKVVTDYGTCIPIN